MLEKGNNSSRRKGWMFWEGRVRGFLSSGIRVISKAFIMKWKEKKEIAIKKCLRNGMGIPLWHTGVSPHSQSTTPKQ